MSNYQFYIFWLSLKSSGVNSVILASQDGQLELLRFLIDHGAEVIEKNYTGEFISWYLIQLIRYYWLTPASGMFTSKGEEGIPPKWFIF